MTTGIVIWVIGWLFTIGWSTATENDAIQTIRVFIVGTIVWPWMLAIMLSEDVR